MSEVVSRLLESYSCPVTAVVTSIVLIVIPLALLHLIGVFFIYPSLLNARLNPIFGNTTYISADRLNRVARIHDKYYGSQPHWSCKAD